ncbi:MAG: hypothetical protein HOV79_01320 [Hamadaea sp.]|nr:hypothetical protein [Hamadaea sp.]
MPRSTVPVVLVALAMLLTACEPAGNAAPSSSRPVHCTVVVDGPERVEDTNRFVGRVRYRCGKPGASTLTLKLRIEQRGGNDRWRTITAKSYTLKGSQTVAAELKYQSKELALSCREGVFRTVVDWSRTSRGDKEGDNLVSGSMSNPCKSFLEG